MRAPEGLSLTRSGARVISGGRRGRGPVLRASSGIADRAGVSEVAGSEIYDEIGASKRGDALTVKNVPCVAIILKRTGNGDKFLAIAGGERHNALLANTTAGYRETRWLFGNKLTESCTQSRTAPGQRSRAARVR